MADEIVLEPTVAVMNGDAVVAMCRQCGSVICATHNDHRDLTDCPCCGETAWSRVDLPISVFREARRG